MSPIQELAKDIASSMDADVEVTGEVCLIKKKRRLNIRTERNRFSCILELDISFRKLKNNGDALNKAEILLLPEEVPAFTSAWSSFNLPLPVNFKQRCERNPNSIFLYLETVECPKVFAARLSAALNALEPLESIS